MKMNVELKRRLNKRSEPYIYEFLYCFIIDSAIVTLMLIVFYKVEILKFGLLISTIFLLLEFLFNYRIAFLCIVDKFCKNVSLSTGNILDINYYRHSRIVVQLSKCENMIN